MCYDSSFVGLCMKISCGKSRIGTKWGENYAMKIKEKKLDLTALL